MLSQYLGNDQAGTERVVNALSSVFNWYMKMSNAYNSVFGGKRKYITLPLIVLAIAYYFNFV